MAALCDLVSRIPTLVVVISCLETFYDILKGELTKSIRDRIENDPGPLVLKGPREGAEIEAIVTRRLRDLYDSLGADYRDDDPTFPFPTSWIRRLAGLPAREALFRCQEYRERSIADGRLVALDAGPGAASRPSPGLDTTLLEQAWNDARTAFAEEPPASDEELAALLAGAIRSCSDEVTSGARFEAEVDGRMVRVTCETADRPAVKLLVGLCNITARGGHLARRIGEVEERAGQVIPVLVRSTEFPNSPSAAVSKQIGALIARGGRRAVVEDAEWRAMMALPRFRDDHRDDPALDAWLKRNQPLGRLRSIRLILGLDEPEVARCTPRVDVPPNGPVLDENTTSSRAGGPSQGGRDDSPMPIVLGTLDDETNAAVMLEPAQLARHIALVGESVSTVTNSPRNFVEQLLLRGVPAIVVDRAGEFAGYGRHAAWTAPLRDAGRETLRDELRDRLDVAVFTPGQPEGRLLAIAVAPPGLGRCGSFERSQVSRFAASALAGLMNYGTRGVEPAREAILACAINGMAQLDPDGTVSLDGLINYLASEDPGLINAVGRLDTKLFATLVEDLTRLRTTRGTSLAAQGETVDAEALLGLGRHARAGKTRLSIITTRFLGDSSELQFWLVQLVIALGRWVGRQSSQRLQAMLVFADAELYLPAQGRSATKEPMEDLLRRARSAGVGILLATAKPAEFDERCRDTVDTWLVGPVHEPAAPARVTSIVGELPSEAAGSTQAEDAGVLRLFRDGVATRIRAGGPLVPAAPIGDDEVLAIARGTVSGGGLSAVLPRGNGRGEL
jgi:hypothetical protein